MRMYICSSVFVHLHACVCTCKSMRALSLYIYIYIYKYLYICVCVCMCLVVLHKEPFSKSIIHKARASAFISVKITLACTHYSLIYTYTLLQVVLQPVEVTPERPPPYIKVQWPDYKTETSVEAVLIVVIGHRDSCVL